ncbi:glycoside hydrolase family 36 protein [Polychaeton citri CBS 116435]|uniref:Alpha-galactosidase n=1 Tax=Polychaeton citri CBS 116435 TaxID=1314669 RepID=A0A9P4Q373_9PEZI|nr:glycoside hydrolase family 36 protein [Polychaeton citri CBS 116435]
MPGFALLSSLSMVGAAVVNAVITTSGTNFTLTGDNVSYLFHVDTDSGDLVSDHFGGPADDFTEPAYLFQGGWVDGLSNTRREFPDIGRSDFRLPAIHIAHADGDTVSAFTYRSHQVVAGKPPLPGLPATYGNDDEVSTLLVRLYDNYSDISAVLSYSIFPKYNAIARSFQITNNGSNEITIERAASFSVDLPNLDLELLELHGDWAHERNRVQRPVTYGENGFRSTEGYSSHLHNPFFALLPSTTTETTGEAWGFNLVYTGSFQAMTERFSNGFIRVLLGLNPLHTSIPVKSGETFTSPEAVAVYSSEGLGGMSRSFHDLYKNHLSRSKHTFETRPLLLNSWEGLAFDINDTALESLAEETAGLGIQLFVMDDGWFGVEYPRDNDTMGLGDWTPNPAKFPDGLGPFVQQVNGETVVNATTDTNTTQKLKFGIWVEPEMVNQNSTLYHEHPDWVLSAGNHPLSVTRHQLVLNVGLPEVQDFIIESVSRIIDSANIQYIKWDNNRGIHEMPTPSTDHQYILGLYRVIDNLTTTYPDILWEGCASGGGRFDPGLLYYWSQHWTSDNTDASNRLTIQFGTSLTYPPSSMGCHVSAVPNGITGRNISITYRAHVAMMCGSFGFELNPGELSEDEASNVPWIIEEAQRVNPLVIHGDFYRLALPDKSNWPAAQFVSKSRNESVVFAFQQQSTVKPAPPPLQLQGLNATARYWNSADNTTRSGATLMNAGINLPWHGDYQSKMIWLYQQ